MQLKVFHPDHLDKKQQLKRKGMEMKNSNLIRRFDVVAVGRDLKLRVVDSNGRVRLIGLEGNERVEVGSGSSYQPSADDKCSVCLEEMQGQVLQLRGCGHVFHSRCLKLVFLNKGVR